MSSFNMSCSLMEEDVPLAFTNPSEFVEDIQKSLVTKFESKKGIYESTINEINNYLRSIEEKCTQMKDAIEHLSNRRCEVSSTLIEKQLLLNELSLRKKALEETVVVEQVTQAELHELLQRVVDLEQENKIRIGDLKRTKRNFVGQMCFYKKYLDIYIDMPEEEEYIFYFRSCKGQDEKRPNEWIRINSPDFKSYSLCDVSLPEGSKERTDIFRLYKSGVPLRQLILQARKASLSYSY